MLKFSSVVWLAFFSALTYCSLTALWDGIVDAWKTIWATSATAN